MRELNITDDELDSVLFWLSHCHGCITDADEIPLRVVRVKSAGRRPGGVHSFCDKCLGGSMKYFAEVNVIATSRPTPEQKREKAALYERCLTDSYDSAFMAAYESGRHAE